MYKEIIQLILKESIYNEVFEQILNNYKRTGKLTGILHLESLSYECEVFLTFVSKKNKKKNAVTIKIEDFFEYFKGQKYKNLELDLVMKELYKEKFIFQGDIKKIKLLEKDRFFESLPLKEWWEKSSSSLIRKFYEESPEKLFNCVTNISKTVDYLKEKIEKDKYIPLPILSALITKDSHYFDRDKIEGKLLLDYFLVTSNYKKIESMEEEVELLWNNGIVKDEFFNFTIAYNLLGKKSWNNFWNEKQPLNISLYNLRYAEEIDGIDKKIFIFENPAVFREIMERFEAKGIKLTLLCTAGQLNFSSFFILDKLVQNGNELYYSGDFDPEGIHIAQKLKERYMENLSFFNMGVKDYYNCKSDKSIELRLSKLNSINISEFQEIISAMKKEKVAGYQESLVEDYIETLSTFLK